MTFSETRDRVIGAMTIYCEASGESSIGKIAVAATLFNRLKTGRFGKTIASVCLHRMQYSEWNADQADNRNLIRGAEALDLDIALQDSINAYDMAAAGQDPSQGATHYYADTIAAPAWAATGTRTVQIGHHIFFKGVA